MGQSWLGANQTLVVIALKSKITTRHGFAPSHEWPIGQDRSKCTVRCLNLLDTLQLILDYRAITTRVWFAPSHDWPICQDCSKRKTRCLDLLNTLQLILDYRAVTTVGWVAQVTADPISQDRSKRTKWIWRLCCLNLLDTLQLMLDLRAITTMGWAAPSHNWPISQIAAKAYSAAWTCWTPLSWSWTSELSVCMCVTMLVQSRPSPQNPTFFWLAVGSVLEKALKYLKIILMEFPLTMYLCANHVCYIYCNYMFSFLRF